MDITTLRQTPANADLYVASLLPVREEYPEAFGAVDGERMRAVFLDREVTTFAATTDGEAIVGVVSVSRPLPVGAWSLDAPGSPEIGFLFRRREAAGQAIGRRLFARALEYLEEVCVTEVFLSVMEANTRARAIYEEAGFYPVSVSDSEVGRDILMKLDSALAIKAARCILQEQLQTA